MDEVALLRASEARLRGEMDVFLTEMALSKDVKGGKSVQDREREVSLRIEAARVRAQSELRDKALRAEVSGLQEREAGLKKTLARLFADIARDKGLKDKAAALQADMQADAFRDKTMSDELGQILPLEHYCNTTQTHTQTHTHTHTHKHTHTHTHAHTHTRIHTPRSVAETRGRPSKRDQASECDGHTYTHTHTHTHTHR
jgi:metabotropic glutamate receptor 6/7/8